MKYPILKFLHVIGAILLGGGLIGVWLSDLRSRQLRDLRSFAEAVRNIALFYDGVVVPGALILLSSGTWLIIEFYGGWDFVKTPWLSGMAFLFSFEFIEGNTVTRLYFMRLRRLSREALLAGSFTTELTKARGELVPAFTHFLDIPMLFLIVALGVIRPATWRMFFVGMAASLALTAVLTAYIPRLYPWGAGADNGKRV